MASSNTSIHPTQATVVTPHWRQRHSGVSWAAVLAGAVAAAALSLILLVLGTGLGLASLSPWSSNGIEADTFGISTIIWISLMSLLASGLGGYLAGRLGSKWDGVHADEVYFRDTAHGFLAWAIATLMTATLLSSAVGSIIGTGAKVGASLASGVGAAAHTDTFGGAAAAGSDKAGDSSASIQYFTDSLFRKNTVNVATGAAPAQSGEPPVTQTAAAAGEVTRIFANAVATGSLPIEDQQYLGAVVAQRTGVSQAEGEKRVTDIYASLQKTINDAKNTAKTTADQARKASAYAALWLFVSLLLGAFAASYFATFGARHRSAYN